MDVSRRAFLKGTGAVVGGSTLGALGFADSEQALAASVRPFKLERTTETRNTCPYCSVSCGVIMYGLGDGAKNAKPVIMHIEGDPDHPVNRGTLCPKGAALLEFVHSETRTKYPLHRKPGTDQFERVTWDFALERIARLMKDDRDANFIAQEPGRHRGQPLAHDRLPRRLGHDQRDRVPHLQSGAQHRDGGLRQPSKSLTRPHGGQSGPNFRSWRDDECLDGHQERRHHRHHGR